MNNLSACSSPSTNSSQFPVPLVSKFLDERNCKINTRVVTNDDTIDLANTAVVGVERNL